MSKLAHSDQSSMDLIEARSRDPNEMDAESSAFAMELLMPDLFLRMDLEKMGGIDIEDEKKLSALAKRYRVSVPVMALRIGQLIGVA